MERVRFEVSKRPRVPQSGAFRLRHAEAIYRRSFNTDSLWQLLQEQESWASLGRSHGASVLRLPLDEKHKAAIRAAPQRLQIRLVGWRAEPIVSRFRVVPTSRALHAQREAVLDAVPHAPAWIRHVLVAQVLLDAGFPNDALERARCALALRPGEPHAFAIAYQGLRACGLRRSHITGDLTYEVLPRVFGKRREAKIRCGFEQNASEAALHRWDKYWADYYLRMR